MPQLSSSEGRVEHIVVVSLCCFPCIQQHCICCEAPLSLGWLGHVSQVGLRRLLRQWWFCERIALIHRREVHADGSRTEGGGASQPRVDGRQSIRRRPVQADATRKKVAEWLALVGRSTLIVTLTMSRSDFCPQLSPCVENHGVSCSHHTLLVKAPREMYISCGAPGGSLCTPLLFHSVTNVTVGSSFNIISIISHQHQC